MPGLETTENHADRRPDSSGSPFTFQKKSLDLEPAFHLRICV